MTDPAALDPLTLPSVPLLDRKRLHRWSGIYFLICDSTEFLYIGQSPLIKDRWNHHQCLRLLTEEEKQKSRIHWLATDDEDLKSLEAIFLRRFYPTKLNRVYPDPTPSGEPLPSTGVLQVRRVVEIVRDFPELGQRIRIARERDGRTLTQICRDCGLSRSYWYQLESEDLRSPATEEVIRRIEEVLGADLGVKFDEP